MTSIVYWSQTGVTQRVVKPLGGVPLEEYSGGPCLIAIPSYGSPRTGNYVPARIREFLKNNHENIIGIIGVGNRTFGSEFCLGAYRAARKLGVPVVAAVDMVPTRDDIDKIQDFLNGGY